jgi:hypothetical protein
MYFLVEILANASFLFSQNKKEASKQGMKGGHALRLQYGDSGHVPIRLELEVVILPFWMHSGNVNLDSRQCDR